MAFALALLIARLLSASYGAFYEGDEISIAAGVAGISHDSAGHLYRYGPQVGYYRLVEAINALLGGSVATIPPVMVTLSVVAGTLIPVFGFFAFRSDLSKTERWVLAGTLAANPILWMSSRYGNTAMVSSALVVAAVVLLSNRPAQRREWLALALFGSAILVRADAVLATGAIAVLLWRNRGFPRAAFTVGALGILLAAIYGVLFAMDPYMVDIFGEVARHLNTPSRTRFFELLLWAISPFPLVYAILGFRDLEPARRWLMAVIAAWCVPSLGFYFASTTTARYFILPVFAISIAAAVGMVGVAHLIPRWPRVAWSIVLLTATLHLFVGLSNFYPSAKRGWLNDAKVGSHDGDVLTGAFLYDSYRKTPIRSAGVFHPLARKGNPIEESYLAAVRELRDGLHRNERILLIYSGGDGHGIHYFLQEAAPRLIERPRGYRVTDAVTYGVGEARLTTIGIFGTEEEGTSPIDVKAGDVVWLLGRSAGDHPETEANIVRRLPPGLLLGQRAQMAGAPMLWTYRVEGVTP